MSDENKKYVPEGVYLVCSNGTVPTQLICDPQEINIYGVRYADENDNKPQANITSFGVCKTMGTCAPPFGLTWIKLKEDVTLHGFKPLLEDSECHCAAGSGIIKIFFDKYAAEVTAENNSESGFVKESFSSSIIGQALMGPGVGQLMHAVAPDFVEGAGRGFKKGAEGTWNLAKDIYNKPGETLGGMAKGLGSMAVIGAAYGSPLGALTGDATLQSIDGLLGTNFRQTKDNLAAGVSDAASHSYENVRRGNWSEVAEDIGQVAYIGFETVLGSKGAGLALRGAKTGAQGGLMAARGLIGAQRLAQIGAKSTQVLNRIKFAAGGIVRVGRRIEFEPNTLGTTGGNIRLRPNVQPPPARIPVPGDADFTGPLPTNSWRLTPTGDGAHLIERANVRGRVGLQAYDQAGTPRFYPNGNPENAGQAHIRLHEATRNQGIRLRGGNANLTDQQLMEAYQRAYSDSRLNGIRGSLRTPNSNVNLGDDLTPAEALDRLTQWQRSQQPPTP